MADGGELAVYLYVPFTKGSVSSKGYEGWIRITEFSFSVKAPVTMGDWMEWLEGVDLFEGDGLDIERPEYSEFDLSKPLDDASGDLLQQALTGGESDENEFILVVCAPDAGSRDGRPKEYVRFTMQEALIEGYELDGGDDTTEKIKITYNELSVKFIPINPSLAGSATIQVEADLHD